MIHYMINNYVTGNPDFVTSEEEAFILYTKNKNEFLSQEAHRFSAAKVIQIDDSFLWSASDFEKDAEDSLYSVYNHVTGEQENLVNKTEALIRIEELKQKFLEEHFPVPYYELSENDYLKLTMPQRQEIPITEL